MECIQQVGAIPLTCNGDFTMIGCMGYSSTGELVAEQRIDGDACWVRDSAGFDIDGIAIWYVHALFHSLFAFCHQHIHHVSISRNF